MISYQSQVYVAKLLSKTLVHSSLSRPNPLIMTAVSDTAYFTAGWIQLLSTFCLLIPAFIFRSQLRIFNVKYGKSIGYLLLINGVIQCLMGIIMMINSTYLNFARNFVFESLALLQQALYYRIISLIGGIYNEAKYEKIIKKIGPLPVCSNHILCEFVWHTNGSFCTL